MISETKRGAAHYRATAVDLCLIALAQGPLIRDGKRWRFGRRHFSNATVRRLIDAGAAVLIGNTVRSGQASIDALGPGGPDARSSADPASGIANHLVLAFIPKSRREELQVTLCYPNGEPMVALSVHRRTDRGSMVSTGKALAVRPTLLPDLIRALQAAEASLASRWSGPLGAADL